MIAHLQTIFSKFYLQHVITRLNAKHWSQKSAYKRYLFVAEKRKNEKIDPICQTIQIATEYRNEIAENLFFAISTK